MPQPHPVDYRYGGCASPDCDCEVGSGKFPRCWTAQQYRKRNPPPPPRNSIPPQNRRPMRYARRQSRLLTDREV